MTQFKFILDKKSLEIFYTSFIHPILEYSSNVWINCTRYEKEDLEKVQPEAARIATGATKLISTYHLYEATNWVTLENRRNHRSLMLLYKMHNNLSPAYLSSLLPATNNSRHNLRNIDNLQIPHCRTSFCRSLFYQQQYVPGTSFHYLFVNLFQYQLLNFYTSFAITNSMVFLLWHKRSSSASFYTSDQL